MKVVKYETLIEKEGFRLKKKRLAILAVMTGLLFYGVGNMHPFAMGNEDELIEKIFEGELVFNEAAEKYGVTGLGVSKRGKQLRVILDSDGSVSEDEVKKYFDKALKHVGVKSYSVDVFFD